MWQNLSECNDYNLQYPNWYQFIHEILCLCSLTLLCAIVDRSSEDCAIFACVNWRIDLFTFPYIPPLVNITVHARTIRSYVIVTWWGALKFACNAVASRQSLKRIWYFPPNGRGAEDGTDNSNILSPFKFDDVSFNQTVVRVVIGPFLDYKKCIT